MAFEFPIFWPIFLAALGYLAYKAFKVVTVGFVLQIVVPCKRSDVFRMLLDTDNDIFMIVHPICIGLSNITRSHDEQGRRVVQYDIEERVTMFGFYESTAKFRVTVTVIQENAVIQNTAKLMGGMLQTKQTWYINDSGNEDKDEIVLEDHAEYTAPRILAMLVQRKAYAAHIERNNDIRRYFIETSAHKNRNGDSN